MEDPNEIFREMIVLSEAMYKQKFRTCFVEHLLHKIDTLFEISSNHQVSDLIRLQIKLLEPVMYHLRNTTKSSDKCLLIQYLLKVLKVALISDVNVFFHLYILIFSQIFNNEKLSYVISEELKMIVFEAGVSLITNTASQILNDVLKPEYGEKYSIGIFLSIQAVKNEKCIQLRLNALNFLLNASQYIEDATYDQNLFKNLGDLFVLYLPGIVGPLQEIILRGETQQHLITLKALTCWGHVICLVLNDHGLNEDQRENEILKQWIECSAKHNVTEKNIYDYNKALSEKKRTKTWMKAASETLKPLICKVTDIRNHSNPKCRLELVNVMIKLHKHCKINLQSSLTAILEAIVGSTFDEDENIKNVAKEYVHRALVRSQENKKDFTIFTIEKNFCSILNKLPGTIHTGNEKLILSLLQSLSGYLKILGEEQILAQVVNSLPLLQKLLNVIQLGFLFELHPELSREDFSPYDIERASRFPLKSWKKFRYFQEETIKFELERICKMLGKYGDAETIIDYLLDTYFKEYERRKEILLIINQIVLGIEEMNDSLVNQMLDFYLDLKNLDLPLALGNEGCTNIKDFYSDIIKIALIMEGMGHLARNLKSKFQDYMLRTLYVVVENMGSKYSVISLEAHKAAVAISTASSLGENITSLIKNNIDYLTYHSTNKLKRNDSGVFDVITVVISSCSLETLSDIEEIINNVLSSSFKNLNSPLAFSYLRLFQTFVVCIGKLTNHHDKFKFSSKNMKSEKNYVNGLLEYLKNKEEELRNESSDEENEKNDTISETERFDENPENLNENSTSNALPKHVTLTLSISHHCLHFLASKDKDKKLIALQVLNESLLILHPWENELLPLVHKIWSPLMTRFEQISDSLLIRASFNLVCTLAFTSKQFIRSRTLRNILPKLQSFLLKEAPKSKFKDSSSGYYFTQNFKLQRDLLENLGNLTVNLELFEKQTDLVIESATPYLSIHQPKELQEKCLQLFSQLKSYDPYLVWLKLHRLHEDLEYSKNIKSILEGDR